MEGDTTSKSTKLDESNMWRSKGMLIVYVKDYDLVTKKDCSLLGYRHCYSRER
jgi:hypothetical protein